MSALYDKKKCPLCGGMVILKRKGAALRSAGFYQGARHNGFLGMYHLRN